MECYLCHKSDQEFAKQTVKDIAFRARMFNGTGYVCKECKKWEIRLSTWKANGIKGMTKARYNQMLEQQENRCAICKRHESEFRVALGVDHNHETHEPRGLLCIPCNLAMGMLDRSETVFSSFQNYISKYGITGKHIESRSWTNQKKYRDQKAGA